MCIPSVHTLEYGAHCMCQTASEVGDRMLFWCRISGRVSSGRPRRGRGKVGIGKFGRYKKSVGVGIPIDNRYRPFAQRSVHVGIVLLLVFGLWRELERCHTTNEALDRPTIFLSPTRQTSKPDAISTMVSAQGTRVWQTDPPAPVQVARSAPARVLTAIS